MDPDTSPDSIEKEKSETGIKPNTIYYGVFITHDNNNAEASVFEDKDEAMKEAKKHKKSRFKAFQFYHEAVEFSLNGADIPAHNSTADGGDSEKKEAAISEKGSPFRTPRPQELTEFRSRIECGHLSYIREMIEYNPRYLVSSGDTPSILQEGARLNALHVAAKVKSAPITELILTTVSNPSFIKRLYGDENQENAESRCKMLLDLYLNTPNKGFNDTPLHIASKWGADRVVEILLSYPECDKTKKNKHNKLAEDVICERVDVPVEIKRRIQQLLCDNFYVPVLRSEDNSLPPLVGQPFSPTSPPVLNKDPLSPRFEIHAYAGPMEKKEAETFRKVWKTPPRSLNFASPNGKKSMANDLSTLRLKDHEKGLERIGKKIANNFKVSWKEYWEFLDCFVDIASEEGLKMLESHLRSKSKDLEDPFEVFSPLVSKSETVVSPITSLCNAFSACKIEDSTSMFLADWKNPLDYRQTCRPLVYVDKACHVFANRIITNVNNMLYCNECEYENIAKALETEIKLLELLINSYMDDERFTEWVNFQKVHSHLAHLLARKLCQGHRSSNRAFNISKLGSILENIVKRSDYFSSDDEGINCKESANKPTTYRKQVVCLLSRIKGHMESPPRTFVMDSETLTSDAWDIFDVCNCNYHPKKTKRNNLSRNSSFKGRSRRAELQSAKRLCFDDNDVIASNFSGSNCDLGLGISDSSKSDSDDEFYTPLGSPTNLRNESSDSEEQFSDAEPPKLEVFLEGAYPTKTDCAVYNALKYAECKINKDKHPLVYKWYHSVNLFEKTEREAWPSSVKSQSPEPEADSPRKILILKPSWFRITGANSPKAAIKTYKSLMSR